MNVKPKVDPMAAALRTAGYTGKGSENLPRVIPPAKVDNSLPPLRDGQIHLGDTANGPVGLDLGKLIEGRLLIQGNSGAGKSMLLRRMFEQSFGLVQQLVIDADGEFATLKEKFDVAVLPAAEVLRVSGRAFALHMREHRYSAILDLSDATSEERLKVVADIANGLIEAPAHHWNPLVVLIDEAQTLAPHYDTGDVDADTRKQSIAALSDLMGRGRKRGIAGVVATQRLAETSKAVCAKATNIIIGRTIFDRDLERAGSLLGLTVGSSRTIRSLSDGEFLCLGPALAGPRRIRFKAGPVVSAHKGAAPKVAAPPKISAQSAAQLLQQVPSVEEPVERVNAVGRKIGARGIDWKQEWDQIVRDGYERAEPLADIGKKLAAAGLQVATSGISTRAHALGLISENAGRKWTEEEDQILTEAYANDVRIIDIADMLAEKGHIRGRTAIQMRAISIGITRDRVNYWSVEETALAKRLIEEGKTTREIIAELKAAGYERGVGSINKFCQKHNIVRSDAVGWTDDDINKLRDLYNSLTPIPQIEQALGRTRGSIMTMASKLGLKQRKPWSDEEKDILRKAKASGVKLVDCQTLLPGRTYATIARMAAQLRLDFSGKRGGAQ